MAFTKSAVEELSSLHREPDWLRARRLTSFGIYEGLAVPDTKRQEDWRQVDLKGLDLEGYAPFQQPNGTAPLGALENVGATLRQRGTSPAAVAIAPELTRQGVIFMPLAEAARVHPELVQRYLFTGITPERDKFAALHAALFSGGSLLYLPEGPGSPADLRGLFFGTGDQAFDFRTLQDHVGPHTTSALLFKGALRDRAKSVYVGVVRVEPQARGSSSNQANRNLLLSEKAKATSEPILEILNNDILRCSHGATVGPVDPEHLFYLESRGIPHPVAERMLVQGFLGEVLDRIPVAQVREAVDQELAARIE